MNASFDQPVGSLDELVTPCQSAFFWTIVIFIGFKIVTKTRDPFGCNLDLPVDPGETKVTPEPPDSYTAYIYIYILPGQPGPASRKPNKGVAWNPHPEVPMFPQPPACLEHNQKSNSREEIVMCGVGHLKDKRYAK